MMVKDLSKNDVIMHGKFPEKHSHYAGLLLVASLLLSFCSRTPTRNTTNSNTEPPVANKWELRGSLPGQTVSALAMDSLGVLYAGSETAGVFMSTDTGKTWTAMNRGFTGTDISQLAFDRDGHLFAAEANHGIFRWDAADSLWSSVSPVDTPAWSLLPLTNGEFFAGMSDGIYATSDGGAHWNKLSDTTITSPVLSLTMGENDLLLAGTFGDGLYYSIDMGSHWRLSGLNMGVINTVFIDSQDRIFVGLFGGGLLRSMGNLMVWETLSDRLNSSILEKLVETSAGVLFAATHGSGVFSSVDGGNTWEAFNTDLSDGIVPAMMIDNDGFLLVGTDSGSVFRTLLPISEPRKPPDFGDE